MSTREDFEKYEREIDGRLEDAPEKKDASDVSDLVGIMSTVPGRRFVMRLLRASGVETYTFSNDQAIMNFNAGRQSVGYDLLNDIKTFCFGEYLQMLKEHNDG